MTDESFMTEADIICEELEEARAELAKKDTTIERQADELAEKGFALAEQNILIKQLQQELAALKGK